MSTTVKDETETEVEVGIAHVDPTEVALAPSLTPEISFAGLRLFVIEQITAECLANGKTLEQTKQEIGQVNSALTRAMEKSGSSTVRHAIEEEIKRSKKVARKKGNRNPKRRAEKLLDLFDSLEARKLREAASTCDVDPGGMAGPRRSRFGRSIVKGREAKGLSQTELSKRLELSSATMSRWEHSTIPLADDETHEIINRMEAELGYKKDFQWKLISDFSRQFASWPKEIPNDASLRRRISERVGNLRGLSEADQHARRLSAYTEIQAEDEKAVVFEPYSLGMDLDFSRWPGQLEVDWTELLQSHMAFEKLPDGRQHVVAPPDKSSKSYKVDRTTGKTLYRSGKPMLNESARYNSKAVSLILGSCINPIKLGRVKYAGTGQNSNPANAKTQVKLPPLFKRAELAEMGLAAVVCPEIVEHYFRAQRIMRALLEKPEELSKSHVKYIGLLKKIVKWLMQQPHFVDRLRPIDGLLSAEQIEDARGDWRAFCNMAIVRYEEIYEGHKDSVAESFDHGSEIEDFLVNESQIGLLKIFGVHADELQSFQTRDMARAIKLRDTTAAALKALCYYRPGTDQKLNYTHDNKGHLRHHVEDGAKVWRMHLTKHDVKNHYSQAMKDGESRLLHNIGGRFYSILEEYLSWARPFLLAGRITDAIIVRTSSDPRHTPDSYGTYVKRITKQAMKTNQPEFYGAQSLNCIQIRKAAASDAYRMEGTFEAAGKAIGNTAKEAQVYVKVLNSEHTKKSTERTRLADERLRAASAVR